MTEKEMWATLYTQLKKDCSMTRLENAVSFGIPDLIIGYMNRSFWVETKIDKGGFFLIRPSQIAWHIKHIQCNCLDAYFLVYMKNEAYRLYLAKDLLQFENLESYGNVTRVLLRDYITWFQTLDPRGLKGILNYMFICTKEFDGKGSD